MNIQNNFKDDNRTGVCDMCTHLASVRGCISRILQPEAPKEDKAQNKEDRKADLVGELWMGVGEWKETQDDDSSAQETEGSQPRGRPGSSLGQCLARTRAKWLKELSRKPYLVLNQKLKPEKTLL